MYYSRSNKNMCNEYTKVFQKNLHFVSDNFTALKNNNIYYYSNYLMNSLDFKNSH